MRERKITLGEMRESDVQGLLIYCADYKCSHLRKSTPAEVDRWHDSVRLSDLEPRLICQASAGAAQTSGLTSTGTSPVLLAGWATVRDDQKNHRLCELTSKR
jgi:hypothetical protein